MLETNFTTVIIYSNYVSLSVDWFNLIREFYYIHEQRYLIL